MVVREWGDRGHPGCDSLARLQGCDGVSEANTALERTWRCRVRRDVGAISAAQLDRWAASSLG